MCSQRTSQPRLGNIVLRREKRHGSGLLASFRAQAALGGNAALAVLDNQTDGTSGLALLMQVRDGQLQRHVARQIRPVFPAARRC